MRVRLHHLHQTWRPHPPYRAYLFHGPHRFFHPSFSHADDNALPNHYATLGLQSDASPGDVKKQFYKLSKTYHPDVNPHDETASAKFVKVSEAYATLGSPEKRGRYDRDFLRAQPASASYPSGSFSSSSSPAGGRPASGLSRRRTQFQGPPESFYRSGGWGPHSAKRSENAEKASHSHEAQGRAQSNDYDAPAGTGPGGFTAGFDNDVPHFDRRGHYQTHSTIEKTRHRSRRKRHTGFQGLEDLDLPGSGGGSSMLLNFVTISGALAIIFGVSGLLITGNDRASGRASGKAEER